MTDITERLAEIEARVEAATEGPWRFEPEGESHCGEPQCCSEYWDNRIWGADRVLAESHMLSEADAELIAHARTDVPWLVEQVRELQAERDTYRDRWRQLMRDHEAVVKERDELEAENERLRDTARNYEIAMHAARGERDGAWAEAERLRDDLKQERRSHRGAHDAGVATMAERDAAREQVRQRDEVIERVRELADEFFNRLPDGTGNGRAYNSHEVARRIRAALEGADR